MTKQVAQLCLICQIYRQQGSNKPGADWCLECWAALVGAGGIAKLSWIADRIRTLERERCIKALLAVGDGDQSTNDGVRRSSALQDAVRAINRRQS